MEKRILVEGHRGYAAKYPENTLPSYTAALDAGVDAIEFDVWLSRDGVPVLMHDGNAWRTCRVDRHLRDMTVREIKALEPVHATPAALSFAGQGVRVPTFEEWLAFCRERCPRLILGVEIKEYTEVTVDRTVALLRQYGFLERCYFYAFNGRILSYIKKTYGGRTMGYPDFQMAEFRGYDDYDEIGLSVNLVRSEIFPHYRAMGLPMHMYCADDAATVRLCMERGASLITANDPTAALDILGKRDIMKGKVAGRVSDDA